MNTSENRKVFCFQEVEKGCIGKEWVKCLAKIVKNTHRENTPSHKTEALTKGMNMYIWAIGTLNQLFISGSYIQIKFSKK